MEVMFYAKGAGKCQVSVEHRRLKSAKEVQAIKKYWGEQLERLERLLQK